VLGTEGDIAIPEAEGVELSDPFRTGLAKEEFGGFQDRCFDEFVSVTLEHTSDTVQNRLSPPMKSRGGVLHAAQAF
jgi:hypothetical protein